jgi:hypothetical protein
MKNSKFLKRIESDNGHILKNQLGLSPIQKIRVQKNDYKWLSKIFSMTTPQRSEIPTDEDSLQRIRSEMQIQNR